MREIDLPRDWRIHTLISAANLALRQADYPAAHGFLEESLALARRSGRHHDPPGALRGLGIIALHEGDYRLAAALNHRILHFWREREQVGSPAQIGALSWTLETLGLIAYSEGELLLARSFYEQALDIFRGQDNPLGVARACFGLGRVTMREGQYSSARSLLNGSLGILRELWEKHCSVWVLNGLAWISRQEGDLPAARACLREALLLCKETRRPWETIHTLITAGHLAEQQGDAPQAARLFGAAEALRASIGEALPPIERPEHDRSVAAARSALGEADFAAAWAEGRAMTMERAITSACEPGEEAVNR